MRERRTLVGEHWRRRCWPSRRRREIWAACKGRAALVGVIAELAKGEPAANGASPSYVPLADKSSDVVACHARCWRLLAALASENEPERAGWWLACLPSNARERKDALSNVFDDAKRAAHSALWVRLADFAKNAAAAGAPAVDVEVLAASCRRGADGTGAAAAFALEAGLVALKDALRSPTDAATASAALRCAPLLRDTFRNVPVLRDADPDTSSRGSCASRRPPHSGSRTSRSSRRSSRAAVDEWGGFSDRRTIWGNSWLPFTVGRCRRRVGES